MPTGLKAATVRVGDSGPGIDTADLYVAITGVEDLPSESRAVVTGVVWHDRAANVAAISDLGIVAGYNGWGTLAPLIYRLGLAVGTEDVLGQTTIYRPDRMPMTYSQLRQLFAKPEFWVTVDDWIRESPYAHKTAAETIRTRRLEPVTRADVVRLWGREAEPPR
jgi:hypothetical protein